jgi:hypothetical protein
MSESSRKREKKRGVKRNCAYAFGCALALAGVSFGSYLLYGGRSFHGCFSAHRLASGVASELLFSSAVYDASDSQKTADIEGIINSFRSKNVAVFGVDFIDARKEIFMRPENDSVFLERFIAFEKTVVRDFSVYACLENSGVEFYVPSSEDDVSVGAVNLVNSLSVKFSRAYDVNFAGGSAKSVVFEKVQYFGSSNLRGSVHFDGCGFSLALAESPVFCAVSLPDVALVETPVIEFLHSCMREYTVKHVVAGLKSAESVGDARAVLNGWGHREELVVHSAVFEWMKAYAVKAGLSERSVLEEERRCASSSAYYGLDKMLAFVQRIGAKTALELYKRSPDLLFAEAGLDSLTTK